MSGIITSGDGKNRDQLSQSECYIAIITPGFVSNDKCLGEMRDADALKKPMYALVDSKTRLPREFHEMKWNMIIYYTSEKDFRLASIYLKGMLDFE